MDSQDNSPPQGGDGGNYQVKLMTEMILRSSSPEHLRYILNVLQMVYATGLVSQNTPHVEDDG
jgi:hypothetical protein